MAVDHRRQGLSGEPAPPPVSLEGLANRLRLAVGIKLEEGNNARPMPHGRIAAAFLPIGVGFVVQVEAGLYVSLAKAEFYASFLEVLAERLGFSLVGDRFECFQ